MAPQELPLSGLTALVTGAARGIGRGCALELARGGADVALVDVRHREEGEAAVAEIEALGRRAGFWLADVGDRDAIGRVVGEVAARFGRLDVAVANAGVSVRQEFLDITSEGLETTLRPTMYGVLWTLQAAGRQMARHEPLPGRESRGKLLAIASIHAEQPFPRSGSYNMAKAGVTHLLMTAAAELAGQKINVNVIHPGWIDTPGERQHASEQELAQAAKSLPWKRLGKPEEIGRVVAFLAGPGGDFVSGSVIRVDAAEIVSLRSA
ncbi:MAG TPA: SDR family oxidoreductase [Chloroflexota bacterium]|nr:SDR family oxidoreductase [Chloroflexota bacterium]